MSNKAAALELASRGFRIFPCNPDKSPRVKAWEQTLVSSPFIAGTSWDQHTDALVGLPAGANGMVVIDCDRKPNRPDGVQAFYELCQQQGIDRSSVFVVATPSGGCHFYFRTDTPYGNSRGSLPDGIDVRGVGGYVIAPGSVLPDGRAYSVVYGSWDAIPPLPNALASFLRPKTTIASPVAVNAPQPATEREREYATAALTVEVAKLSEMTPGSGRNAALNASAHSLGTMIGAGWLDAHTVAHALLEAATVNGHTLKHGEAQTRKTIESGMNAGIAKLRLPLQDEEVPHWLYTAVASWIEAYKAKLTPKSSTQNSKRSVTLMQGSDIEAKPITWLWDGYLPSGKLTLLAGAGGTGKSTIAFNLAATITNGGTWPDGTRCKTNGNVLIWSSEDDPSDTIKPRLMAVGANERRYGVISGTVDESGLTCPFDASRDMEGLREAVSRIGGVSLLIIDPIITAVTGDMHKANDVRRSLQAIVDFAAEMKCTVLGITHFAKGTAGRNSAERVIGSQAFAALARMVLVAAKEEESDRRVFTRAKSNNSIYTGGYRYSIEALTLNQNIVATRVVWGEALEGSSRSILAEVEGDANGEGISKIARAKKSLLDTLRNGPTPSKELLEQAREGLDISKDTMRRAQGELGIVPRKLSMGGGWVWELPVS